ncbi:PREDICTED: uncharacterized protein LOC104804618 isoform X2 [Tarenaya hassleriana]|nr:PREDICTED: uncharacterized protein LOC104804618 isoform X2 [Tarenaya hassleriana]XP_010527248.1 PREDICTED: uncharacterized protein LOC104804618 isoform X2 [Tarenaya hassleriana]
MIQMDGGDRIRVTLLDQLSTVESRRSLTLEAVLRADKRATPPPPPPPTSSPPSPPPPETTAGNHANRTLLDVMRDENRNGHGHGRDKTAWKSLREKLRLKRSSAAVCTSTSPSRLIPTSDTSIPREDNLIPDDNRFNPLGLLLLSNSEGQSSHSQTDQLTNQMSNSADVSHGDGPTTAVEREGGLRLGAALAEERALSARETNTLTVAEPLSGEQPPRMSLMELLEEHEGQMGVAGIYDVGWEEDERDGGGAAAAMAAEKGCCVCMIRSKGAAFIPCGHTFCRLCSRELWVQRGNCPLCNASILEILDIF